MGLLGTLVKTGLTVNQKLSFTNKSVSAQQREQLQKLLYDARNTAFGKYYGFDKLLKKKDVIKSFREVVPIHDYHQMHAKWWEQQQSNPDITWPGKPDFFALSSGTTGKSSKRIPITDDFLQSIKDVGNEMMKKLPDFDFPKSLFEKEILMLSSSSNLDKNEKGHYEGEISGINVSNFPSWYDIFYRPGKEIASINDWDKRVEKIAEEAPDWDIGAIAGIPSWVLLMLQKVIEKNKLNNIHEIWPDFSVYASGGVAYDTYREDFERICGKPITIMDTYLASEGFFAFTGRPGIMDMQLALSHGYYYEFIPFDERGVDERGEILDDPEVFGIEEVKKDTEYVLVVSSCAGAWRYIIGDTIKFTNTDPHEILITGRTKFFLNTVGSQLSEEKMDAAIVATGKELSLSINEYMVAAIKNDAGDYIHQWVVVSNDDVDTSKFAAGLDDNLRKSNKNYDVARSKALKDIDVKHITKTTYHGYLSKDKKKGGQVKTPKVMPEDKMEDLLDYISG